MIKKKIDDLPIKNKKPKVAFNHALLENVRNVVSTIINKAIKDAILCFISFFQYISYRK